MPVPQFPACLPSRLLFSIHNSISYSLLEWWVWGRRGLDQGLGQRLIASAALCPLVRHFASQRSGCARICSAQMRPLCRLLSLDFLEFSSETWGVMAVPCLLLLKRVSTLHTSAGESSSTVSSVIIAT